MVAAAAEEGARCLLGEDAMEALEVEEAQPAPVQAVGAEGAPQKDEPGELEEAEDQSERVVEAGLEALLEEGHELAGREGPWAARACG